MKILKRLIATLALLPTLVLASEGGFPLDHAPARTDLASMQRGAKLFVNYCLNCHSAAAMRYNRLRDIGLTEDQIRNNLLFTSDKVGDLMKSAMTPADGKRWFGAAPPDLSVIVRAKDSEAGSGSDYIYTYLRTFYADPSRPTGWNNMVYPNVAMPHVLWELQGIRNAKFVEEKDEHEGGAPVKKFVGFEQVTPGSMSERDYDEAVADLVSYMSWMSEPVQFKRRQLGTWVLIFLGCLMFLMWRLNASFWREVK